jgi:hypothetical protein
VVVVVVVGGGVVVVVLVVVCVVVVGGVVAVVVGVLVVVGVEGVVDVVVGCGWHCCGASRVIFSAPRSRFWRRVLLTVLGRLATSCTRSWAAACAAAQ